MQTSVQSSPDVKTCFVSPDAEAEVKRCVAHLTAMLKEYPFVHELIISTNGAGIIAVSHEPRVTEYGPTLTAALSKLRARIPTTEQLVVLKREQAAKLLAEAEALVPRLVVLEKEGAAA